MGRASPAGPIPRLMTDTSEKVGVSKIEDDAGEACATSGTKSAGQFGIIVHARPGRHEGDWRRTCASIEAGRRSGPPQQAKAPALIRGPEPDTRVLRDVFSPRSMSSSSTTDLRQGAQPRNIAQAAQSRELYRGEPIFTHTDRAADRRRHPAESGSRTGAG